MVSRKESSKKIFLLVIIVSIFMLMCLSTNVKAESSQMQVGYVDVKSVLRVRSEASTKSEIIGYLKPGNLVGIIKQEGDFYLVTFYEDNQQINGYVYSQYVNIPEKEGYKLISAAVITSSKSSDNRKFNMSLACDKLNGLTLEPGEQFDWYGANGVGKANKANGFKKAKVIMNKKYVEGYGGGVCQVSTTLYNCIYNLGITPDEIHHHSLPSSYVTKGMDATVAYPAKNFKFTNSYDYKIEFEAFADGEKVTILCFKEAD